MLDWAEWSSLLSKKRVLELGSGLGQFGLTALQTLDMQELTLSDFHHSVLNYINHNVRLNIPSIEDNKPSKSEMEECLSSGCLKPFDEESVKFAIKEYKHLECSTRLRLQHIDWREYRAELLPSVDVIVGSDIVFAKVGSLDV